MLSDKNCLTRGIQLGYSDVKPLFQADKEEEMGYLVYSGKSTKNGEVHHIRAFNSNSKMAKENPNLAMTVFLKEALRLCVLNQEVIIQETLEFHENKLYYTIKPITGTVYPKNIDLPRMMEDLIEDLKYLTYCGPAHVQGGRIWRLAEKDSEQYFVQDWNQVLWKTQEKLARKQGDPISTTMAKNSSEKENVCHFGLAMLEVAGADREVLELLLEKGGKMYEKNIKFALEEISSRVKMKKGYADLLVEMADGSLIKRLSIDAAREKLIGLNLAQNQPKAEEIYDLIENEQLRKYLKDPNPLAITEIFLYPENNGLSFFVFNQGFKIGNEGARYLAQYMSWVNLKTLNLHRNNIGDKGARGLGQNTSWVNLQELNIRHNKIENEGANGLAQNTSWVNLQRLDLASNRIGDEGAKGIAQNTSWVNLQTLNIWENLIGDAGLKGLSQNASWLDLKELYLSSNKFGDEGANWLAQNTSWTSLKTLNLSQNSIGDEGAKGLVRNTSWVNLQKLHLEHNKLTTKWFSNEPVVLEVLISRWPKAEIITFKK